MEIDDDYIDELAYQYFLKDKENCIWGTNIGKWWFIRNSFFYHEYYHQVSIYLKLKKIKEILNNKNK